MANVEAAQPGTLPSESATEQLQRIGVSADEQGADTQDALAGTGAAGTAEGADGVTQAAAAPVQADPFGLETLMEPAPAAAPALAPREQQLPAPTRQSDGTPAPLEGIWVGQVRTTDCEVLQAQIAVSGMCVWRRHCK